MRNPDYATIARLLERYMQGTTSLSEEQTLERFFRTATDIPVEWATFRLMFTAYAAPRPQSRALALRRMMPWMAAASVVAAIVIGVCRFAPSDTTPTTAPTTAQAIPTAIPVAEPLPARVAEPAVRPVSQSVPAPVARKSPPACVAPAQPADTLYRQLMAETVVATANLMDDMAQQHANAQLQTITTLIVAGELNSLDICAALEEGAETVDDLLAENV